MQQIQLINYDRPKNGTGYIKDRYYRVHLNRDFVYFKSKKKLLRFMAELNAHLNTQAHALNRLTAEVHSEYRYYFFHFTQTERGKLENEFNGVNRLMGLLVTRSQTTNGNGFTYDRMYKIAGLLLKIIETLQMHPINKQSTVQRYRLKTLENAVAMVKSELKWLPEQKQKIKV